jgi:iron-sulfur cluster insertion protein
MSDAIIFTDQAAAKVWELIQEEGNFNLKLRVYVTGGGCSGMQYGFTFDEKINADDAVITKLISLAKDDENDEGDEGEGTENPRVQLLVDGLSFQYLVGAEIDYKKDIEGDQFIIRNPNAQTTCGCGSSFSSE